MARRRFQQPQPRKEGNFWYLRIWDAGFADNRKRQRIKLAPATTPLREVQKIAAEKLRPVNQGLVTATSAVNFATFVQSEYIAALPLGLSRPTENSYRGCISKYLEPAFGNLSLRELTPSLVQQYFSRRAGQIAHPTILKIRDALSSVLRYACENDFLVKNPLEHLKLPKDKRPKGPKPIITPDEFNRLVTAMAEPYASAVFVSGLTGLRVPRFWRCVGDRSIVIATQSESRNGFIAAITQRRKPPRVLRRSLAHPDVLRRLDRLKSLIVQVRAGKSIRKRPAVKSHTEDDLVFQSVETGVAMNDQNILKRHLQPAARRLGLKKVDWRMLRRSFCTWLVSAGADVKSAQGLMRHTRVQTTLDIYAQMTDGGQMQAIEKLAAFRRLSSGPIAGPELVR